MHHLVSSAYRLSSAIQGGYLLLMGLAAFAALALFPTQGSAVISASFAAVGLFTGLFLLLPRLQPGFVRAPKGALPSIGAMLFSSLIFLTGVFTGYVAVIALGLPEPLSRHVALATAVPTTLLTGIMWWAALLMVFVPPAGPTPDRPEAPPSPPPASTNSSEDLRKLRKSRMA